MEHYRGQVKGEKSSGGPFMNSSKDARSSGEGGLEGIDGELGSVSERAEAHRYI